MAISTCLPCWVARPRQMPSLSFLRSWISPKPRASARFLASPSVKLLAPLRGGVSLLRVELLVVDGAVFVGPAGNVEGAGAAFGVVPIGPVGLPAPEPMLPLPDV